MESLSEQLQGITASFAPVLPEIVLAIGILVVLGAGLFQNRRNTPLNILTVAIVSLAFVIHAFQAPAGDLVLFNGMLRREGLGGFLMMLVDVSLVLTCLMSLGKEKKHKRSEYYALLLSIALGSHLLLMTTNLLMAFLSLELISLSSYVLAGYAFDRPGSEGSLKYFIFGSIASAIMLYGFSLLYGLTGTIDFSSPDFFEGLIAHASPLTFICGLMALSGFLFKMAAVPMHPWAPDVYEAAPMPVIAFLSVAPKLAGIGILAKFILALHLFGQSNYDWQIVLAAVAMLTITVGNFSALWQKNPKRMMAYSSIAHSGFLLVGLVAFLPEGLSFMLFYAAVYLLMNFAVFFYLAWFERKGIHSMSAFSGTGRQAPAAAAGLTVALVALTGLPPTAGFTAKLFIFSALWEAYETTEQSLLLWLLVFGLLNTVISLFFYLRIPYYAFLKSDGLTVVQKSRGFENLLALILVVLVVVIFFIPGLLMGLINRINFVL